VAEDSTELEIYRAKGKKKSCWKINFEVSTDAKVPNP
jgi:hypothetical protein